jgi:hypothetical protein
MTTNFFINSQNPIKLFFKKGGWKSIPKMSTKALEELTDSIQEEISSMDPLSSLDKIRISKTVGPEDDQMEYVFLDKLTYRHCIVLLVLQYSYNTKQLRVIAYGVDCKLHSSQGTNLELVTLETLVEHTKKAIDENFKSGQIKLSTTFAMLDKIQNKDFIMFL